MFEALNHVHRNKSTNLNQTDFRWSNRSCRHWKFQFESVPCSKLQQQSTQENQTSHRNYFWWHSIDWIDLNHRLIIIIADCKEVIKLRVDSPRDWIVSPNLGKTSRRWRAPKAVEHSSANRFERNHLITQQCRAHTRSRFARKTSERTASKRTLQHPVCTSTEHFLFAFGALAERPMVLFAAVLPLNVSSLRLFNLVV